MDAQESSSSFTLNDVPSDVATFRLTLDAETDRGCALMAAAYLDCALEALLTDHFVSDGRGSPDLLGQSKPLGTFSSRIDVTYALGGICRNAFRDLHLIRKIRNDFGHVASPLNFESQQITSRCRELHYCFRDRSDSPRARFTSTVLAVLALIHNAKRKLTRIKELPTLEIDSALRTKVLSDADHAFLHDKADKIEQCFADIRKVIGDTYSKDDQAELIESLQKVIVEISPKLETFFSKVSTTDSDRIIGIGDLSVDKEASS